MQIIGLTGGIGSGKSTVSRVFEILGFPVYNSDIEAKRLNNKNEVIRKGLINKFGEDIYKKGVLNKKKLADIIFNDKRDLEFVNSLIHPIVKKHFSEWLLKQKTKYVIKETAILFETGIFKDVDIIISVIAPEKIKIKRIRTRDGISEEDILARMNNQIKDNERIQRSNYIINNDETTLLLPQIISIIKALSNK